MMQRAQYSLLLSFVLQKLLRLMFLSGLLFSRYSVVKVLSFSPVARLHMSLTRKSVPYSAVQPITSSEIPAAAGFSHFQCAVPLKYLVEMRGLEPLTPALQRRCSPS